MDVRKQGEARLNTTQFMALRSIAREPWDFQWGRIQWKFNGKWFYLFSRHGVRAPLGSVDALGRCGYVATFERAWDAAWELEEHGLIEEVISLRCCPGTSCHANDQREFRLTRRGRNLLHKASATSRAGRSEKTPVHRDRGMSSAHVEAMGQHIGWWRRAASLVLWRKV